MFKKHIIFHILYIIADPLFSVCVKHADDVSVENNIN